MVVPLHHIFYISYTPQNPAWCIWYLWKCGVYDPKYSLNYEFVLTSCLFSGQLYPLWIKWSNLYAISFVDADISFKMNTGWNNTWTLYQLSQHMAFSLFPCPLQKPGMDVADGYVTFVRHSQDMLREKVNEEVYIERLFDVSKP